MNKNNSLLHTINLVVGDWSHDGHSKTETVTILSNLDKKALEKAYKKGSKKVGFDLETDVCADYEDMSMSEDISEKLKAAGIKPHDYVEEDEAGLSFSYNHEAFATLWLDIARLGNPDLKYEITADNNTTINIGGYGLLGN